MLKILIIEDDLSISRVIKDILIAEGYNVITSYDGNEGLQLALENNINVLLLDIMLPGINGYDICRRIKKEKSNLPIIMITARGTEIDKISGLDVGADDYLTKPFSIPELLARIRAVLRRTNYTEHDISNFSFGNFKIDFKKYQAFANNKEIKLSSREFKILKYFIKHEGEVIHRYDLLNKIWGYDSMPTTRTVDNYIVDLRKHIEIDPSNPKHIVSVRGVGYKFISGS